MKKLLALIIACMVFVTPLTVGATYDETITQPGFIIEFNGEQTEYTSVVYNDTHYVPLRKIFEKMGTYVFYRNRDSQILALTRDGDMIYHTVGTNSFTINNEEKILSNPSVLANGETYIPVDMLGSAFYVDGIYYDYPKLLIQKTMYTNEYHTGIKDVLDQCGNPAFYPERFNRYLSYHFQKPNYNMQDVLFRVNLGLDYPFYENTTVTEEPYDLLVLVNKYSRLPTEFAHNNLVSMNREYTSNDGKQYLLAPIAYENYVKMSDAAKQEGLAMKVVSSYRTESYQQSLYNNRVYTTGKVNADNYSARPGHSEHQTGLAVDINSTYGVFEYTAEFKWLQKHAHEYGFILRYPKGKEWITGYSYEPWHYRYVGTEVAKIIYEEDITYEEYYAKYISVNEFK